MFPPLVFLTYAFFSPDRPQCPVRARVGCERVLDVSACWNTLGKLVRREPTQRDWLREELRQKPALQPLLDTTLERLHRFKARPVANTAHGLAAVATATGFVPGSVVWDELATKSVHVVEDFDP